MEKNEKSLSSAWLEEYLSKLGATADVDSPEFQEVKNFHLIWNIFESKFFEKQCTASKMLNANDYAPNLRTTEQTFSFFKSLYVEKGRLNSRFSSLHISSKNVGKAKEILLSENPNITDKNRLCRMIIHRYRNNLFHGEKQILQLREQIELFKRANQYLIGIIDNPLL